MKLWFPLILLVCAVGAFYAFKLAAPDSRPTPAPTTETQDTDTSLDDERLRREKQLRQRERNLRHKASRYLRSLPGGSVVPAPKVMPSSAAAKTRLAEFDEWADGLPAQDVTVGVRRPRVRGRVAHVAATFALRVPQATRKVRRLRVNVTVMLFQRGRSWHVSDVRAPDGTGLRSFANPRLIVSDGIAVLAEEARKEYAAATFVTATSSLPKLRERYALLDGPTRALILVIDRFRQNQEVLGRRDRPQTVRPSGWTYENGDIVLYYPNASEGSTQLQQSIVQHELTHLVTLPLIGEAPTMLLEGIAMVEEIDYIPEHSGVQVAYDLSLLNQAFKQGQAGYQQLLHSSDASFGRTSERGVRIGYQAGYATIAYLRQRYGRPKVNLFLASLRSGRTVDQALERSLGISARKLQSGVRGWVAEQVAETNLQ